MIITVASGKGGTGKTSIATSLPFVIENSVYVDMDAEEPDGHIILKPDIEKEEDFCLPLPHIDTGKCTFCGICSENCKYGALAVIAKNKKALFFRGLCHSCGVCSYVCPEKAIVEKKEVKGKIRYGRAAQGFSFIDTELNITDSSPVRMLSYINKNLVKNRANRNFVIDAAPGAACSVVEAVKHSDIVLLVAEPTLFSLYDLQLVIELVKKLNKPFAITVNKHEKGNSIIHDFAGNENIVIAGEIPFTKELARHCSEGKPVIKYGYTEEFVKIYKNLKELWKKSERNTCIKR